MDGKPTLKEAWLGHVNHLHFVGHQPYLERLIVSDAINGTYFAGECCKLMMVVGQLLITPTVEICIQQIGSVEEMV